MFQTVGHEALSLLPEATGGIPLFRGDIDRCSSSSSSSSFGPGSDPGEEDVEALFRLVRRARDEVPGGFEAVCSGAILSDYQRVRVESV